MIIIDSKGEILCDEEEYPTQSIIDSLRSSEQPFQYITSDCLYRKSSSGLLQIIKLVSPSFERLNLTQLELQWYQRKEVLMTDTFVIRRESMDSLRVYTDTSSYTLPSGVMYV